ncbi:MAG: hypothetical protein E5V49_03525 [Mesorhizobium sp.]|nr:hypothetical protein EN848_12120 [bacterium M00.F.Ca.ET.205.01.1.1]TGU55323.1 hypothetical protein EN795_00905 [bacterium M00.F.Ca.ET.152.01.1.1]TGV40387.1 hypothetical protein EN829_003535 [Mesorhizobium sp. M00.F.Ca.ET.186.01.1.1]TGZ45384.1 hypothetical protein EN805_03515 [bacterium M00.F.Ca.ET.162.01.1.1]TJW34436.1 MAG: hypothetical protein E5V49_03525 [Mesorhizobium sp.]
MRQHMLNGWLVAALFALVCLLGITAYVEIQNDLPRSTCLHGNLAAKEGRAATTVIPETASCGSMAAKA